VCPYFNNLRKRLILYFIILIILPVTTVAFFSFFRQNRLLINDTTLYLQQSLEQINRLLDEKLFEVDKRTWALVSNDSLSIFNEPFESMSYDHYKKFYSFKKDILLSVTGDMTDVRSANFISANGNIFSSSSMFIKPENINRDIEKKIHLKLDKKPLKMLWMGEEGPYVEEEEGGRPQYHQGSDPVRSSVRIMAAREIMSVKTGARKGIIIINFKEGFLDKIVGTSIAGINSSLFIIDDENRYLLADSPFMLLKHAEPEVIKLVSCFTSGHGKIELSGRKNIGVFNTSVNSGWKILALVTEEELLAKNRELFKYTLLLISLGGLAFIGVSILAAFWISWPITRLTKIMETAADGDLGVRMEINAIDEIQKLAGSFNKMMSRIQRLMEKNRAIEREKNLAELKALQMQINPHFLYNTLNSIYSLSRQYGIKPIMDMTYSLSNLFRISFSQKEDMITIRDSIEQLENYIAIQKIRFEEKFSVFYDIEDEVYSCRIPKLMIQPLVENSIVHGIEKKKGKGSISIIGYRTDGTIKIIVQDDGIGIEEERLGRIRQVLENGEVESREDMIALRNINRRLKLNYGDSFGLSIFSIKGRGTTVELILPEII